VVQIAGDSRMTNHTTHKRPHKKDHWDWFFGMTFGTTLTFIFWSISTIVVAWIIEVLGMMYFWGADHSRLVLQTELTYLGSFNRNLLTGIYPGDIASRFIGYIDQGIEFFHLRDVSQTLAAGAQHSLGVRLSHGIEIFIDTLLIFAVRLSVCVSAATGFALVCLVAFIDGLVERDIRRACGGIESAMIYHRSKRLIIPSTMLSFGFYMTSPISIHPTFVFLPIMALVGFTIYSTAKSFKKYL
jgi:integrating conjugative element membrane protein (TIGR03747 family)